MERIISRRPARFVKNVPLSTECSLFKSGPCLCWIRGSSKQFIPCLACDQYQEYQHGLNLYWFHASLVACSSMQKYEGQLLLLSHYSTFITGPLKIGNQIKDFFFLSIFFLKVIEKISIDIHVILCSCQKYLSVGGW